MDGATFRAKYDAWLDDAKYHLLRADWKTAFADYPHVVYEDAPWSTLGKPLSECRVALVSTAGMYIADEQEPFDAANIEGDWSHREIPADLPAERLSIAHEHYNHRYVEVDQNCVYPAERLRELAAAGEIGEFISPVISISGYCPPAHRLVEETIPHIVLAMHKAEADLVLQVPV